MCVKVCQNSTYVFQVGQHHITQAVHESLPNSFSRVFLSIVICFAFGCKRVRQHPVGQMLIANEAIYVIDNLISNNFQLACISLGLAQIRVNAKLTPKIVVSHGTMGHGKYCKQGQFLIWQYF